MKTSKLNAEMKGSAVWGEGVSQHTVFLIKVEFEGDKWIVFRRFSAFEALHEAIRGNVDASIRSYLTANFPEKEFGSFFGTFSFVVDKRIQALKRYLGLLIMHPQNWSVSLS